MKLFKNIFLISLFAIGLGFSGVASASTNYYIYSPRWVGAAVLGQLGAYFTGDSITLRSDGSSCSHWSMHRYHLAYYSGHKQPSLDHVSPEFYKSYDECKTISLRTELAGQPAGNYVLSFPPGYSGYNGGTPSFCAFSWDGTIADISNCGVAKNPVLIVPGLMGTEMKNGDELLWANVPKMFIDSSDNFMDSLSFNSNLTPLNSGLQLSEVIRKKPLSDYTDGVINEFVNQGYIENETLFTFPYDWRYGVSAKYTNGKINADLLGEKIQEIINKTGSSKVDVVVHSMGGLILKKYVVDHPAGHHIGKAVFVGVPNLGAVKTIKALLLGDNFDISFSGFGLSESEIKKISENMPAAYDLLPSQRYYDTKGSFIEVVTKGGSGNFTTTQKDLNYQEFQSYITDDHGLNRAALTGAGNLHTQAFDNFDLRTAGVDLYAIDGCKAGTLDKIVEERQSSIFGESTTGYRMIRFKDGDGTVPLESATNLPINQSHKFYSLKGEHSKMLSQNGSRQQIVNVISGSNLEVKPEFITQDISKCGLTGNIIYKLSPIDIFVTDQQGNHLGIDNDGSIINEIPNADHETFGDHAFLYLPNNNGQTYDIKIKGTGTGTYTIGNQNIVNGQVTGTEVFSNLPVTNQLTGQINLGLQTTLTVKETPESPTKTIFASANINAPQSQDFAPPASIATLSGKTFNEGQFKGQYKKEVVITINAKDTVIAGHESESSGILNIAYNLDNTGFTKVAGNNASITVSKEGSHAISFFATDNAGNNEILQTATFTVKRDSNDKNNNIGRKMPRMSNARDLPKLQFNEKIIRTGDNDKLKKISDDFCLWCQGVLLNKIK